MDLKTEVLEAQADAKFQRDYEANIKICRSHIASGYQHEFVLYNGGAPADMIRSLQGRGLNAYTDNNGRGSVWVKL